MKIIDAVNRLTNFIDHGFDIDSAIKKVKQLLKLTDDEVISVYKLYQLNG